MSVFLSCSMIKHHVEKIIHDWLISDLIPEKSENSKFWTKKINLNQKLNFDSKFLSQMIRISRCFTIDINQYSKYSKNKTRFFGFLGNQVWNCRSECISIIFYTVKITFFVNSNLVNHVIVEKICQTSFPAWFMAWRKWEVWEKAGWDLRIDI